MSSKNESAVVSRGVSQQKMVLDTCRVGRAEWTEKQLYEFMTARATWQEYVKVSMCCVLEK